jgi:hypothetical protein
VTSRLSAARSELTGALAPVLPGRVQSYPPPFGALAAPMIWLDQPQIVTATIGRSTSATVAAFPVFCVYDGADRGQVAGLDDLVSKAWDALCTVERCEPEAARPQQLDARYGSTLRAAVITAAYTIAARTLCLPDVEESPIPPTAALEEV